MSIGEGRMLGDREVTFEVNRPAEPQPNKVDVRVVVSMVLALAGLIGIGTGAGILWGWGGTLLALGLPLLVTGLLLGQGS